MSYVMIGNWYIIRFILIFTILFPNLNRYINSFLIIFLSASLRQELM